MKVQNQLVKSQISNQFDIKLVNRIVTMLLRFARQSDHNTVAHLALIPLYIKLCFHSNINKALISSVSGSKIYPIFYNMLDFGRDHHGAGQVHITDVLDLRAAKALISNYPTRLSDIANTFDDALGSRAQHEFESSLSVLSSVQSIDQLVSQIVRSFNIVHLIEGAIKVNTSGMMPTRSNLSIHGYRLVNSSCVATSSSTPDAGLAALAYFLNLKQYSTVPMFSEPLEIGLGSSDTVYIISEGTEDIVASQIVQLLSERVARVQARPTNSAPRVPAQQVRGYSTNSSQTVVQQVNQQPLYTLSIGDLRIQCFHKPTEAEWQQIANMLKLALGSKAG